MCALCTPICQGETHTDLAHNAFMKNRDKSKTQGERLTEARIAAGFADAKAAANAFGWNYSTYSQHERDQRGLRPQIAEKYAKRFKVSPAWLLMGEADNSEAKELHETINVHALAEAVAGSYRMMGLDEQQIDSVLRLVFEIAQEPLTPSAGSNYHRVLSESVVRKFLESKRTQNG